jgi:selenocysteine lyase/cysteine desulfurase
MNPLSRRNFINRSIAVVAGAMVVPSLSTASENSLFPNINRPYSADDERWWDLVKSQFSIRNDLIYFNNGSLGPSPEYVIDKTEKFRRLLDGYPSKYMWGGWESEKEDVRSLIADYFSVDSEEIAIIHNTTEGMNLFARSFDFKPGDEIILADHEHVTGTTPYQYYCERRGVKLVRPVLPLMPEDSEEIVDVYRKAITPKTRLISMVHMTNTNGMFLPVKEVSEMAHKKGVLVCVDGAQTAGMIKLDLHDLGCDYYAASGHKWLFGPKGTGVLYAKRDMINLLEPLIVARPQKEKSIRMFEDYNTRNLPELLGLGAALEYNNLIGQEKKEKRIYELKYYFLNLLKNNKLFLVKTPVDDRLSSGIQVVEVLGKSAVDAKDYLFNNYGIDCRPMDSHNLNALRISLSVFTTKSDVDILVDGLIKFAEL